jgi:pimeloyl-ACP methyl ester carboxylesterase
VKTAVVFVHGFTGGADTWDDFPELLRTDPDLKDFTFSFWKYPSKLNPVYLVTKYFWNDDPNIPVIGTALRSHLTVEAAGADRIMLVGHSMGGLAVQTFILEELVKKSATFLSRTTEVILCGTPSAGLTKADWGAFFKNQISDMAAHGAFVGKLRASWKLLVDDERTNANALAGFRLTPIAGISDQFVPQESSLDPFPLDDHFVVPGDHTEMVKPRARTDDIYRHIKLRLMADRPTGQQISANAAAEAEVMSRVAAARELDDRQTLRDIAAELKARNPRLPRVERELGLALLAKEDYALSAEMLRAYLDSDLHRQRPEIDGQAIQQLSIALSGTGNNTAAVAELQKLPARWQADPETQGIRGGRIKRQWLETGNIRLAIQARTAYASGLNMAVAQNDDGQIVYNGINAAYLSFVLDEENYAAYANQVLAAVNRAADPDYWTLASAAEAELILGNVEKAKAAYLRAWRKGPEPRHWVSTGKQALDIAKRKDVSADIEPIFRK